MAEKADVDSIECVEMVAYGDVRKKRRRGGGGEWERKERIK
jgi:hypothetical protein